MLGGDGAACEDAEMTDGGQRSLKNKNLFDIDTDDVMPISCLSFFG